MSKRSTEEEIARLLAKYSPEVGRELSSARRLLRSMFPRGHELVYDNYNALVFAFSATASSSQAFLSVAGYPKWVNLFFSHGVGLNDPQGLLQGSGQRVRSIRLVSAEQIMQPAVQSLILQAMGPHRTALAQAAELSTTIKSVSVRQRPRRATSAAAKAQGGA